MKRIVILLLCLMLCGCRAADGAMDRGLALRGSLLQSSGCEMDVTVTADYGDKTYTFAVGCQFDAHGKLSFTVTSPETISGISGTVDAEGGNLTFDDVALAFPLLADEQLSPISAPWVFMKTLRGGYITAAGEIDRSVRLIIDDRYEEDALTLHIWLDGEGNPSLGEIYHNGRRILTVEVNTFHIL